MQMVLGNPQRDHNPWVENHCSGMWKEPNTEQHGLAWRMLWASGSGRPGSYKQDAILFSTLLSTLLLSSKEEAKKEEWWEEGDDLIAAISS